MSDPKKNATQDLRTSTDVQPTDTREFPEHLPIVQTGNARIDASHAEIIGLINRLVLHDDLDFLIVLATLHARIAEHFAEEDESMRALGSEKYQCHLDEHAAVLASIEEVKQLTPSVRSAVGHRLVRHLQGWFPGHVEEMDLRLEHALFSMRTGGLPVRIV